jgi:hypothetical protein
MKREFIEFVPDVTAYDWAALLALCVLILASFALGVWLVRWCVRHSRGAAIGAAGVLAFCLLGLGALVCMKLPQFSKVTFTRSEVVVDGIGGMVRLPLGRDNLIRSDGSGVTLVAGSGSADLPGTGSWRFGELVVNAKYLANEFRGRSAYSN